MKTNEYLAALQQEIRDLDDKLTELSEDELKEVVGGAALSGGSYADVVFIHKNCGGEILHVGNPFSSCVCSICGETHYWHFSFDFTKESAE